MHYLLSPSLHRQNGYAIAKVPLKIRLNRLQFASQPAAFTARLFGLKFLGVALVFTLDASERHLSTRWRSGWVDVRAGAALRCPLCLDRARWRLPVAIAVLPLIGAQLFTFVDGVGINRIAARNVSTLRPAFGPKAVR